MRLIAFLFCVFAAIAAEPCRIQVVEKTTGWPVPLVELRTTHQVRFVTDNNGIVAIDAPELLDRQVWFDVLSPGYEVPKDGFGMRGVRLTPQAGKSLRVEVDRTSIAKRLGRVTGAGIFGESQRFGDEMDWKESGVFGQDTVQNAAHRGKMFWIWGDTTVAGYPLGIFNGTGAMTDIAPLKTFHPPLKLQLDYFKDQKGAVRGVAPMPGEGPTWITGFASLRDKDGRERMVASYMKVKNHLEVYRWGLCVWTDAGEKFEPLRVIWEKSDATPKAPLVPDGHPAFWDDSQGKRWLLFGNPLPKFRCPATFEAWKDSSTWEELKPQETIPGADGKSVKPHSGSIAWNAYRRKWIAIFMESFGKPSAFGEIWYAEASSPLGSWGPAIKILSHDNYTFYNPRIHPEFTPAESPILIFEGTYTEEFANHPHSTQRYNYNQIMYRIDLDDPKLKVAQ